MVKITLEVLLDNEFAIFYPEQIIGGKVKLTINDELKVSAINIKLEAHGNVRWSEGSGEHRRTYSSHECYLNEVQCLLAKAKGEKDIMLPSGTHEYQFRFQLPKQLPSSFEGQIGHVRYQLKGHVDRPWALDSRCKRVFTLVNPVDLNTLPDLTKHRSTEKSKHLCCCCCKSDPIIATMTVNYRRGYVPGETISFSAEINNKSGRSMKRSVGRLTMEVTYHATSKSRTCTNILTKTEQGRIKSKSSDTWTDGRLQIPAVPPSFLEHCNIIDIRYYAQMQVVPAGPAISLKVPVEIVIGNVPLKEVADQYNGNFSTAPIPTGAPRGLYSDTSIPSNNPHASFAESVFGRKSIKDDEDDNNTSGDIDFVPKYTYYNWETRDPISNFTVK